jgi:serine/threonine protein kinase
MIDTYQVVRQIGRGAFGSVYMGVDRKTGENVAIKSLDLSDKSVRTLFLSSYYF